MFALLISPMSSSNKSSTILYLKSKSIISKAKCIVLLPQISFFFLLLVNFLIKPFLVVSLKGVDAVSVPKITHFFGHLFIYIVRSMLVKPLSFLKLWLLHQSYVVTQLSLKINFRNALIQLFWLLSFNGFEI